MKLIKYFVIHSIIQCVLFYMLIKGMETGIEWLKLILMALLPGHIFVLAFILKPHLSWCCAWLLCIAIATSVATFEQFLAFTCMPGLMKDVELFSLYHVQLFISFWMLVVIIYSMVFWVGGWFGDLCLRWWKKSGLQI